MLNIFSCIFFVCLSHFMTCETLTFACFCFLFFSDVLSLVLASQSCLTLCNPMDCSPPGFSVHGILQARILEWVAIPFSRGVSPTQGLNPGLPHCRQILYHLSRWSFLIYFKNYVTYWGYSQFSHYTYCKYFSTLSSTFHFVSFTHINCDLNHQFFCS